MAALIFLLPILLFSLPLETSFPYLSGYTWVLFSDWRLLGEDYVGQPESFSPEKVKRGDTIFLDTMRAEEFAKEILPHIQDKVILISANYGWGSDHPLPGRYAYLLEEEKIAAWFVQNIDREPSEKLIPIPIGLASKNWPHGNTELFTQVTLQKRSIFCYLNYAVRPEREDCTRHFLRMGFPFRRGKPFPAYLKDLAESVFVVSPPGNGLDCHRTWEALLMGCYPVVKSSPLNPLYEGLPVVIVESWSEVTEEFLEKKYSELNQKDWPRYPLYAPHWFNKVKELQAKLRDP